MLIVNDANKTYNCKFKAYIPFASVSVPKHKEIQFETKSKIK